MKGPIINGTRVYQPAEDPFPHFSFLSPLLSPGFSSGPVSLPSAGTSSSPTTSSVIPLPQMTLQPGFSPNLLVPPPHSRIPEPLMVNGATTAIPGPSSPVSTVGSATLVGTPLPPASQVSSATATSERRDRSFSKLKEWARGVQNGWKSPR